MPFPLSGPCSPGTLAQLQSRQREYKLAALHAKQQGDTATAAKHFRVAKVRPEGSGLEVEDRMLLTLCDSKEQGFWSQTDPDLNPSHSVTIVCCTPETEASVYPLCEMGINVWRRLEQDTAEGLPWWPRD